VYWSTWIVQLYCYSTGLLGSTGVQVYRNGTGVLQWYRNNTGVQGYCSSTGVQGFSESSVVQGYMSSTDLLVSRSSIGYRCTGVVPG